jgi:hypothetical protein
MSKRIIVSITLSVIIQAVIGCNGGGATTPVSPSPPAPPPSSVAAPPPARPGPSGHALTAVSLSGTVYEVSSAGRVPIPGARVYCEMCGTETHTFAVADSNGFYIFPGDLSSGGGIWLSGRRTPVFVENRGYRDPEGLPLFQGVCPNGFSCREVLIEGNTHFDIELVRRTDVNQASSTVRSRQRNGRNTFGDLLVTVED